MPALDLGAVQVASEDLPLAPPRKKRLPNTTLDVENTISPIGCNGRPTPLAKPFLIPPYHGFVRLYSYFDHDLPDFTRDGLIVLANGVRAAPLTSPSTYAGTGGLAAYWSDALRQYVYYDGHNGYDYDLVYQPVYAAATGKIIFAGWNYPGLPVSGYGQMIMIDHGHGYVTLYGHLSHIQVKPGEHVRAGQEIAISGNTGHSSGPHLHFTVFHDCKPTDPYGWTGTGADPLTGYQGETSAYLWRRAPQVLNPIPHWPGLGAEAAPAGPEILDLHLPPAHSLAGFIRAVRNEHLALQSALEHRGLATRYDRSAAAFILSAAIRPSLAYSLPDVVAVTPDTQFDLSTAQTSYDDQLALRLPRRTPTDLIGGPWKAFVTRVGSQTFLAGHGPAGTSLEFVVKSRAFDPAMTESNGAGGFVAPMPSLTHGDRVELITPGHRYSLLPPRPRTSALADVIARQTKVIGQSSDTPVTAQVSPLGGARGTTPPSPALPLLFLALAVLGIDAWLLALRGGLADMDPFRLQAVWLLLGRKSVVRSLLVGPGKRRGKG